MTKPRSSKRHATAQKQLKDEEYISEDEINRESEDFFYDDIDQFYRKKERDSEEYEDSNYSNMSDNDEEEVLSIDDSDDESDSHMIDSADEDDEDNDIPSSKAWGRKKSAYYGAESLEGLQGFDRDAVQDEEEEEALKIQRRLAEEIDEDQLAAFPVTANASQWRLENDSANQAVITDVSNLSTQAQWKLLKKESPELKELIKDFKEKSAVLQAELQPLMELARHNRIHQNGEEYVKTRYKLYVTYLLNISFYMALKMKKIPVHNHPVVKRLAEYRTLINKLRPVDEQLQPEIHQLLFQDIDSSERGESLSGVPAKPQWNGADDEESHDDENCGRDGGDEDEKVASDATPAAKASREEAINYYTALQDKLKRLAEKESENIVIELRQENEQILSGKNKNGELTSLRKHGSNESVEDNERRAINYTMSKNEGLKAKKRKIDRNPRVKHKERYRKALVKRKSQVRPYRPELQKYSGEASGIRAGVIRGVRIK